MNVGTFGDKFSVIVCPFCWQQVVAMAAVVQRGEWHPMFEGIPAEVAGFGGPDKLIGVDLLPCGHRSGNYFWLATTNERLTMVAAP